MRRLLSIFLLLMLVLCVAVGTSEAEEAEGAEFDKVAKDLVEGKDARLDKLIAVHTFVHDEIAETKAQYG